MRSLFDRLLAESDTWEEQKGLSPTDLLALPPALSILIGKIVRTNGLTLAGFAAELDQTPENAQQIVDQLLEKGYIQSIEIEQEIWYMANLKGKTRRPKSQKRNIWKMLDDTPEDK